ncbi:MAG: hydrogenobyrinic acid a,c-diamide synthase (glutamine-hydrolyzing) [Deltaproteobacteria bacterium]|nr:hydrogenobyrinic acid a,c-diamide synthase (glutamine-hydrolyzing) [Deltaproteobacteria bacterium]MCL5276997.1 hydrogenobyrinic acid a,c-diamide synthase (glutamine-hydrolyzing) [Deltaproteobacteria bacterium]
MLWNIPRMIVSGLAGGCGKTFVSVGMASALRKRGKDVFPFKKGPDYIDSAWLFSAAARQCYNLDTFLMGEYGVVRSFEQHTGIDDACGYSDDDSYARYSRVRESVGGRIALIEGNRGLFDGMDQGGTYSTAELAKLLKSPVVLVLDSTKSTRTLAAQVLGCQRLDPAVRIEGVILNRIAGKRHEEIASASIERICGIPVLGAIPKLDPGMFPERHLGLVTPEEYPGKARAIVYAEETVEKYVDLDRLLSIADAAGELLMKESGLSTTMDSSKGRVRMGVVRDAAFSFYYPDNIEALVASGSEIVEISSLRDHALPDIDALYIGGGFPETNAAGLAGNEGFRSSVRAAIEDGLPVYAECGGAIYMGRSLTYNGRTYPMTGTLPVEFDFDKKPQGHGYTVLEVKEANPYFDVSSIVHGHEFHYSRGRSIWPGRVRFAFGVQRGYGFNGTEDGICYKGLLAVYSHIHAAGTAQWAENFVYAAGRYSMGKSRHDQSRPYRGNTCGYGQYSVNQ